MFCLHLVVSMILGKVSPLTLAQKYFEFRLHTKQFSNFNVSESCLLHRRSKGSPGGMSPPFLAYLVVLCFEKRLPKQSIVARLNQTFCPSQKFLSWIRHCPSRLLQIVVTRDMLLSIVLLLQFRLFGKTK